MKTGTIKSLVTFLFAFTVAVSIRADTITWTNTSGGNWSAAANWNPNQVPGSSDDAVITTSGNYTVTLDTSPTVNSLTLGGASGTQTLTSAGNSLTVNNPSTVNSNGIFELSGGNLAGVFSVIGTLNWSGGSLNPGSSLTIGSNGVMDIEGSIQLYGVLTNCGTVNWQEGSVAIMNNSVGSYTGEIWNETNALWDIQCDQSMATGVGGTGDEQFNNAGVVQKDTTTGTTSFGVYLANTGTVHAESGTISFTEGSDLGGSFQADANAAIYFAGGDFTALPGVTVGGAGTVALTGGNLDVTQLSGSGLIANLQLTGGTIELPADFQGGSINNLTLNGTTLGGTNTVSGTLNLNGGAINGSLTVLAGGVFNWSGGSLNPGSSLTIGSNGVMDIEGSIQLYGVLTNCGTVNWQEGSVAIMNNSVGSYTGEIWNETNALWDIQCDQSMATGVGGTGDEQFNNAGVVQKDTTTGTTSFGVYLANTGTVHAESGTISFTEGSDLGGSFQADANAAIYFAGGDFTALPGVTVGGAGTVALTGGNLDVTQLSGSGLIANLQLTGGTIELPADFQGGSINNLTLNGTTLGGTNTVSGTLNLNGGAINGSLTVLAGGVFNWSGGSLNPGSSLTIGSNGVMDIEGSIQLYGVLTNCGTVNWQEGSVAIMNNSVGSYTGEIWNETNALWDIQCDQSMATGVGGTGDEQFNNAGVVQKDTTTGTTSFGVYLANTGTVHAESGTISFTEGSDLGGSFQADANAAIYFAGGDFTALPGVTVGGAGTVALTGGNLDVTQLSGSGLIANLQLTGGTIELPADFQGGSINNLTLNGTTLGGTNTVSGTLNLNGGAINGSLTVLAGGVFNWSGGSLNPGSSLTIGSNGVMDIEGSIQLYGVLTNCGTVNWQEGSVAIMNNSVGSYTGEIWNETNALWDIQCDQSMATGVGGTGDEQFNNAGVVQKDTTTGTTSFNVFLNNYATIEVDMGTISLQEGYSNSPSANLVISLGGTTPDSGYGSISFSTPLLASGTFTVNTSNGFQPSPGDAFAVLSYPSLMGIFTNFSSPSGAIWQTNYTTTSLILTNVGQINWTPPTNITYGASLGVNQLNASTTPSVAGTFAYNPMAGTVLDSGAGQLLTTTFTPSISGYAPASFRVPITVLQAPLSITATNQAKTYGQTFSFAGTEFVVNGLVNGDAVTSASLTSDGTLPTAPVSGSPFVITISNVQGNAGLTNYLITYVDGELAVNPAPLGITANSTSKTYGQNITFAGTEFVSTPLQNSETIGTVTLTSSGAISNAPVSGSPYNIVPSAATGGTFTPGNYAITYTNGQLTVNRAELMVTANNTARNYGAANPTFSASYSGFVNNETASVISGAPGFSTSAILTSGVGGYAITPLPGTLAAANYTFGPFNNGTLTINPAVLSITASNLSKTYGQTVTFAGTEFAASGLLNSDTVILATLTSAGAVSNAPVGGSPYSIVPSAAAGSGLTNYSITYNNGELTVNRAPLGITANSTSKTYGQNITFAGTEFVSTPLQNSETIGAVTLTSSGAISNAPVSGSPYSIVLGAATGGTFNPANYSITYTNGTLTINPANLTITASAENKTYGQVLAFGGGSTLFNSSGLQNNETVGTVTLAVSGNAGAATAGKGTYTITPSGAIGGTFNSGNYTIAYDTGTLTVNPASLTIAANNRSKTYGQTVTFAGTEFTPSGLQNSETVGSVMLNSSGAISNAPVNGSPYSIVPSAATGGTFSPTNYNIAYVNGALTVNPATLTITANNTNKIFGQKITFAGTEFAATGLQNGEIVGSVTLTSTGAAATAAVGAYDIVPSAPAGGTFVQSNYSDSFVDGTLTVSAQPLLTVTLNGTNTVITFPTMTGEAYQLQSGTGLLTSEWLPVGGSVEGTGESISVTNPIVSQTAFYRLQIQN